MAAPENEATRLAERLAAIASPPRMRIIAELHAQPLHVSELARRVEMSRALLYMHLRKLEEAGFVSSELTLSEDGRAMNTYSSTSFSIALSPSVIADAVTHLTEKEE